MSTRDNNKEWSCPLCYKMVKFGTMGCDDPDACPEKKNYVFFMTRNFPNGRVTPRGIGISEIANEDNENE